MIQRNMRVSMAATLGMLFVMLAFGRGRLAPFYDGVGTAAAEFAANVRAPLTHVFMGEQPGPGEAQGPPKNEISPPDAVSSTPARLAAEAVSPDNAPGKETPTAPLPQPEREAPAEEASPALPDPQAVRDSAAAEVEALPPLHDELIEVLEAIHEALTDREEKRQARQRVTLARLAKRHQIQDLRLWMANFGKPGWSIPSARRSAERGRARLEHEIAEAKATLAKLREPEPWPIGRP